MTREMFFPDSNYSSSLARIGFKFVSSNHPTSHGGLTSAEAQCLTEVHRLSYLIVDSSHLVDHQDRRL